MSSPRWSRRRRSRSARRCATPTATARCRRRSSRSSRIRPPPSRRSRSSCGEYWDRSLAAHWPRLRALLEGDVLYRARRMADGGAQQLFADIDPAVSWKDGVLRIVKRAEATVELDERGLLFVPSVFVWPAVVLITAAPWQPTLIYPARGVGSLWEPEQVRPPDGARRAPGPFAGGGAARARAAALDDRPRPRARHHRRRRVPAARRPARRRSRPRPPRRPRRALPAHARGRRPARGGRGWC